ncbi:hypothetical protein [Paraburkholderia antibiotica]|uniref:Helix-turn-helix transcriptional regulator n=1 Tax=Paraburkholderia antibiotica TaxID=2728839 RepID=A0A7Y0A126_9BURK|nr:hypothetical protein [Paraburkholderia antibiotica]NML34539.1 helix-turn-helix transcriptional regulator [Paraburkholderia antibiotica]
MTTIENVRRRRLEEAVQLAGGTLEALADRAGLSAAYLSQIRNALPDTRTGKPKGLGSKAARKIEQALGKSEGWMDIADEGELALSNDSPHGLPRLENQGSNPLDAVSEAELVSAIEVLQKVLRAKRSPLASSDAAAEADVVTFSAGEPKPRRARKTG